MLTAARNELLTRVGPGTPMGDLLRRYWQPIGGASELDNNPIKPIRLLGEDLVLYKDLGGRYGLVDRHCPHRRADMSYGWVEESGIRCSYHGWLLRRDRRAASSSPTRTPPIRSRRRPAATIKAYPVREMRRPAVGLHGSAAGAGTAGVGAVHLAQRLSRDRARRRAVQLVPVPGELHRPGAFRMDARQLERAACAATTPLAPKHLKLKFEEFEHGFIYKRVREGQSEEDRYWTVGRVALWPNGFYLGRHFEWRVPVDDENTLSRGVVLHARAEGPRALRAEAACRPG